MNEIDLMRRVQTVAGGPWPTLARAYSAWGDHALGWMGIGIAGTLLSPRHRREWAGVAGGALAAHAAAVAVKRVVRRPRPSDPAVRILVATPSDLSFPSAHSTSTTAAAVGLASLIGAPSAAGLVTAMGIARLTVGVHYPSDVLAGVALGAATGVAVRQWVRR